MMSSTANSKIYVLLDRDGTIAVDKVYQKDPALTELFPRSKKGLDLLKSAGFGLVMITNQSGIARGYLTPEQLIRVNRSVAELLGGPDYFDAVYYCPHMPEDDCQCRKPRPGMAEQAARDLGFSLADAFVIGDRSCDIELGKDIGATAILVRNGNTLPSLGPVQPDYVADDLLDAAAWIIHRVAQKGCGG